MARETRAVTGGSPTGEARDGTPPNDSGSQRQPLDLPLLAADAAWQRRLNQWTWGLLVLGIVVRLGRYLVGFPLWGDEYALMANLLDRGYAEMLQPLNCHQVAPLLFLWAELTSVKLLGLSEYSVRLVPTLASVLGLVLFHGLARRLLKGAALFLAVGAMAVPYYAIRHGAEAKPYAVDLCVSIVLLRLAVEAWARPDQRRWLWALALAAPLAVGLSYPAAFVAGGVGLALALDLWQRRDARGLVPLAAYGLTLCGAFVLFLALAGGGQYASEETVMTDYWRNAFPPLAEPWRLPLWFLATHAGEMFAWPIGGERGGSTLTLVCFVAGTVLAARSRRGWLVLVCLAPFGLGMVAAALERYPYGGHPRLVQYLGPMICLLSGLGGAAILARIRFERVHKTALVGAMAILVLMGGAILVRAVARPYQEPGDLAHRDFAQAFWKGLSGEVQTLCVESQLGYDLHPQNENDRWFGSYLCLRRMYDPCCPAEPEQLVEPVHGQPLTCVVFNHRSRTRDEDAVRDWLGQMADRYELVGREVQQVDLRQPKVVFRYEVYRFRPRVVPPEESETPTPAATMARRPGD